MSSRANPFRVFSFIMSAADDVKKGLKLMIGVTLSFSNHIQQRLGYILVVVMHCNECKLNMPRRHSSVSMHATCPWVAPLPTLHRVNEI